MTGALLALALAVPDPTIAALGDSITYGSVATWNGSGWTYTRATTPYPASVQAALGWTVTNHGLPGDTTAGMLSRYTTDVRPEVPRWVVILAGTNDLSAGATAAQVEAGLDAIVTAVQADGATPVLVTILPRGGTGPHGSAGNLAGGNAALLAVNDWIRARGLRYVDAFALFDDGAGKLALAYDSGDGVHLNQAGDDRLAAGVLAALGARVDPSTTYQSMGGFGAGICSHEAMTDADADFLFTRAGLGLTFARQYMDIYGRFNDGAQNGDFSPPYPPGLDLQNSIKAAARGVRHMAFAQWAPKAWRDEAGGTNKILPVHYAEWAARYAAFLDQATANGIAIDGFSVGNEPDSPPWGLIFTPAELHTFVHDYLAPAIAASSQPNCKIIVAETASSYSLASYVNAFSAAGHLTDIGITSHHDYAQTPQIPNIGKPFWQTEASANPSGLYWARRIHDYVSAGAAVYTYLFFWGPSWYASSPDSGLLGAHSAGKPPTKRAYAFAQFARYVRPGDVRVAVTGAPAGVYVTAYKRANGAFSIVLVNENTSATPVALAGAPTGITTLARHETIETAAIGAIGTAGNLAALADVAVTGGAAGLTLSGRSVTTLHLGLEVFADPVVGGATVVHGARGVGATVDVSAPGGAVGAVTYPDATSWSCAVSLAPGATTITATSGSDSGTVDVFVPITVSAPGATVGAVTYPGAHSFQFTVTGLSSSPTSAVITAGAESTHLALVGANGLVSADGQRIPQFVWDGVQWMAGGPVIP